MENGPAIWPIFILTLPGEESRRTPLLQALDELGLGYELVFGVDGRKGLPPAYEGKVDRYAAMRRHNRYLTDGELACSLSHHEIYQRICSEDLAGAIVLEDDARIGMRFIAYLQCRAFEKSDLVLLDHSHARVRGAGQEVIAGVRLRYLTMNAHLTTGYSVSQKAARWLVEETSPVRSQADWPGDLVKLGAAVLDPRIVDHPPVEDDISHLDAQRRQLKDNRSERERLMQRLFSWAFWSRWITKRLSTRIS